MSEQNQKEPSRHACSRVVDAFWEIRYRLAGSRKPAPDRQALLMVMVDQGGAARVGHRMPSTPEQVRQTVYGPKIKGYCSECQGPMEQAVSGVSWHSGPCCHWHVQGTDCCRFIPLPASSDGAVGGDDRG